MQKLLLQNYALSKSEIVQSLLVSEYGLRHLNQAKAEEGYVKWGHRIIAAIELCPLLGPIATLLEAIIVQCFFRQETSSSLPNKTWFFRGTQDGCYGPVAVAKAEALRAQLQAMHPSGIEFNPNKIVHDLEDGTCSAMSFAFIDGYLKAKKDPNCQPVELANRVVKLGEELCVSSSEMRVRQAAFNTIEIRPTEAPVDYSLNKIQSMANYHGLVVDQSSSEIDTQKMKEASELACTMDSLPEGTYLIRILKPADNEKLEEHGHSLAYVKEQEIGVFYDPNYGARNLSATSHASVLFAGFKNCLQSFNITKARFYRLH